MAVLRIIGRRNPANAFTIIPVDGGHRALIVSAYPVDEDTRDFEGSGQYSEIADVFLEEQRDKQLGGAMIAGNAYERQYADINPYND